MFQTYRRRKDAHNDQVKSQLFLTSQGQKKRTNCCSCSCTGFVCFSWRQPGWRCDLCSVLGGWACGPVHADLVQDAGCRIFPYSQRWRHAQFQVRAWFCHQGKIVERGLRHPGRLMLSKLNGALLIYPWQGSAYAYVSETTRAVVLYLQGDCHYCHCWAGCGSGSHAVEADSCWCILLGLGKSKESHFSWRWVAHKLHWAIELLLSVQVHAYQHLKAETRGKAPKLLRSHQGLPLCYSSTSYATVLWVCRAAWGRRRGQLLALAYHC